MVSNNLTNYWRRHFHPELTRERSIRFLLFEIKRVCLFSSFSFKICQQKDINDKRLSNYVNGVKLWSKVTVFWNIDRTEPLNPRVLKYSPTVMFRGSPCIRKKYLSDCKLNSSNTQCKDDLNPDSHCSTMKSMN